MEDLMWAALIFGVPILWLWLQWKGAQAKAAPKPPSETATAIKETVKEIAVKKGLWLVKKWLGK